jgi:hypothetical protein
MGLIVDCGSLIKTGQCNLYQLNNLLFIYRSALFNVGKLAYDSVCEAICVLQGRFSVLQALMQANEQFIA